MLSCSRRHNPATEDVSCIAGRIPRTFPHFCLTITTYFIDMINKYVPSCPWHTIWFCFADGLASTLLSFLIHRNMIMGLLSLTLGFILTMKRILSNRFVASVLILLCLSLPIFMNWFSVVCNCGCREIVCTCCVGQQIRSNETCPGACACKTDDESVLQDPTLPTSAYRAATHLPETMDTTSLRVVKAPHEYRLPPFKPPRRASDILHGNPSSPDGNPRFLLVRMRG